ncbi:Methyltransferase domain-containing protein [Flagellimonas taeanensis]|uniref:Methyltransferase domain-containing protein n=1 Tax=Flagellimonas taeanensis TaxID=1005926 RepID=A0A1M6S987_9FLAO|nr:methyltransferase domain-containing protein [Allomuricauda taeanensis]SFB79269.1 Methyltransferase domain-containing protein [Allomuricauda taeanensis]SHK41265.1 Methyltransferase domain-containing protein [Allomuricauda taeanensis]
MSEDILKSWEKNASEWVKVIQSNSIPSRKYTNVAILDTIKELKGKKIVDIGCGEGWLTREMEKMGWETTGLDAIESLITEARKNSKADFHVFTYENIIDGKPMPNAPFDAAVFNFCLYLKEGLHQLLTNTLQQLSSKGTLVIQTLHPFFLLQNGLSYKSQWLSDSWKGLPGNFTDGHSWYARTFEDWTSVLNQLGGSKICITEIVNDEEKPISLILKLKKQ